MDKQTDRDRVITIKINGETKSFTEENNSSLSPLDETAAAVENADESFDWILPDHDEASNETAESIFDPELTKKKTGFTFESVKQTKNFSFFKRPLAALFLAVLIGACLGIIVLKIITAKEEVKETSASVVSVVPSEDAPKAAAAVSSLEAFVVQGGVFSTEEAAKKVLEDIEQKQIPVRVFPLEGKYFLFLGTAPSLEAGKKLSAYYKGFQLDVYWKPVTLDYSNKMTSQDQELLHSLSSVYKDMTSIVTSRMLQEDPGIKPDEYQGILTSLNKEEMKNKQLKDMYKQLVLADEFIKQTEESSQPVILLKAQARLLTYLRLTQELSAG
ncbi:hypothetical protein D0469_00250 [Peribacillus saganii]|uniref:SPOR domain-containing protein n=1 Tax=Peribacillus saganii TaxID=2303992 RepID=A0A372LTQ8_9BACI|nr:hypothetical protein [Peribacillus saganii]RFU71579.1 hypothetical protein D0469_00250 [Peribacillus saganii]